MNASELMGGHEVEQLFARLSSIDESDRAALRSLARELEARIAIEERTLYPIARTTEFAEEAPAYTVAAIVLARMESGPFDPKLGALLEVLEAQDEEPDVDALELERIGDEIARRVEEAMIATTIVGGRRRRVERERVRMAARRRAA